MLSSSADLTNDGQEESPASPHTDVEKQLAQFEAYIIQRVRSEIAAVTKPSSVPSAPREPLGLHGEIAFNTSTETLTTSANVGTRLLSPAAGLSASWQRVPKQLLFTVEAIKAKCARLEHRQASLEAKVNALVSDVVLNSQASQHEMQSLASELTRKWEESREQSAVQQQPDTGARALVARLDRRSEHLVAAVAHEQQEMGERMREFIGVIALVQQEAQKDRQVQQENQSQAYALMERIIERVNLMDEDIASLLDRQAASENALGSLQALADAQSERIHQLEQDVAVPGHGESGGQTNGSALASMLESATRHQKNHESAVSQKLLAVSAQLEQVANGSLDLHSRLVALRREQANDHQRTQALLRRTRTSQAAQLAVKNRHLALARCLHAWRSWQAGREQIRRDQLILKLFAKQKTQLDLLQEKVELLLLKQSASK